MLARIRRYLSGRRFCRARSSGVRACSETWCAWLHPPETIEPKYPKRSSPCAIDILANELSSRLKTENHRPQREQCTTRLVFDTIRAQGYAGIFDLST
ncbi:hypothetical protein [Burkholderia catarinensis]|uniref:hypothetical protein n=1 Tax=Burkholderia catarinensis TaxID=1108140 RepID=UPI0010084925|nr:hypothetical protein [Burkholderia catarinensis]